MMIKGGPVAPELENSNTSGEMSSPLLPLVECNALKPQWCANIAAHFQRVSKLAHKILGEGSPKKSSSYLSTFNDASSLSFAILDRLKIKQQVLPHIIANLLLSSSATEKEERGISASEENFPPLILWLKEKGYQALAEKLELNQGYPWDQFKKIRHPILMEQLVDIYLLCKHKNIEEKQMTQLVDFSLYLANLASASNLQDEYHRSHEILHDASQVLGQFIYLINHDPQLALNAISKPHYQDALEGIKITFLNKIQEICERLQNHYLVHHATQLQDPELALHMRIPVEVGKALLTEIGTINVGIIDILSDIFLSSESRYINHEMNLSYALNLLQRSPKLRAEFQKIGLPNSPQNPSNSIIRAALRLMPEETITPLDVRLTALIAILSHLRQGSDRSCFAVSLAIEMLSSHLGFCFKDLRQILEEGKLTRQLKGIKKDIPFVKRINDEDLHKEIRFTNSGELIVDGQKKAPLWEAPGILAACQSIGILNPKMTIMTIIQQLPLLAEGEVHKMEIKMLISKICEQLQSSFPPPVELNQQFNQACFAFSSQTTQPLLKVWENAIANMAEAEEGGMIKTAILTATLDALQFKLGELSIPPSLLLQRFFLGTQKFLYERIRLQYDPTANSSTHDETHGIGGGFVLYNQKEKIEGEKDFREFLLNTLHDVNKFLSKGIISPLETEELNQILEIFKHYLDSEEFIGYLLARYHPSNKFAVSQLSHGQALDYSQLQFTPWLTQTGNDSKVLLKIYLESDKPIHSEKFIASGAEETLINIIELCKHMSEKEKELYFRNPNKLKPLCILGKHRFPFMAGHPSLVSAWQQNDSTQVWIEKFVINPGKKIAETLIDKQTKANFIKQLNSILLHDLSEESTQLIFNHIQNIPNGLTLTQYRNKILEICLGVQPLSKKLAEKLARQIDTTLCASLTPQLKKALEDSAIHFADTNWCKGIQDLHFCFAINPGTGRLELWEAQSNGSHLTALDQNYWLFNQKWEFLTLPEDLIPDDFTYFNTHQ